MWPTSTHFPRWLFSLALLFTGLCLIPVLQSGYYSDDLLNSGIAGGPSFWKYFQNDLNLWISQRGRLLPLTLLLIDLVHYLLPSLLAYKGFLVFLVLLDVFFLGHLVRLFTGSAPLAFLAMLLTPLSFQFRLYHDPILDFAGLMPFLMLLHLFSWTSLLKYFQPTPEKRQALWLFLSLFAFLLALLTYEIAYFLFPVILFLTFRHEGFTKRALQTLLPFLVVLAMVLGLALLIRHRYMAPETAYPGTLLDLDPRTTSRVFFHQVYGGLPGSYLFSDPSHIFHRIHFFGPQGLQGSDLLTIFIFVFALFLFARGPQSGKNGPALMALGLVLMIFPAILIAVSQKYQKEFSGTYGGLGFGYIPVYIQNFGFPLFVTGACVFLENRFSFLSIFKNRGGWVWAALLLVPTCVFLALELQANRAVVSKSNYDCHFRRASVVSALENGFLSQVPAGASLFFLDSYRLDPYPTNIISAAKGWGEGAYPWLNSDMVKLYSGRRYAVTMAPKPLAEGALPQNPAYLIQVTSFPPRENPPEGMGGVVLVAMEKFGTPRELPKGKVVALWDARPSHKQHPGELPPIGSAWPGP